MSQPGHLWLLGLLLAAASCGNPSVDRPNIVILVSDDQDYEHFGFMGHPVARTPTIDSLAAEGAVFTHAFVPMSRCRPAQAALLSGLWPHQNGVYYNVGPDHIDPTTCIANLLSDAGYATTGEGKFWEHDPRLMGFSNYTIRNYETFVREGQEHLFEFIDRNAGAAPMFIWWAPALPHFPHDPPERLLALFDPATIPIPDWYDGDPEAYRHQEHVSLAMEAWLDEGIRELEDKLRAVGELENTLFLFIIDNGYANGLPSKGTAFEKGLRTPAILTWGGRGAGTGIAGGQSFDELVSAVDLYSTLLDYAGVSLPSNAPGVSLRPLIEGRDFEPHESLYGAVYLQTPGEEESRAERDAYGLWVRTPRWKYILYLRDVREHADDIFKIQYTLCPYPERDRGDEDLFDLDSDPYELKNLAGLAEHTALKQRLREEVLAWWRASGGGELDLP
jgi:arylsulfatase A-like enzyme